MILRGRRTLVTQERSCKRHLEELHKKPELPGCRYSAAFLKKVDDRLQLDGRAISQWPGRGLIASETGSQLLRGTGSHHYVQRNQEDPSGRREETRPRSRSSVFDGHGTVPAVGLRPPSTGVLQPPPLGSGRKRDLLSSGGKREGERVGVEADRWTRGTPLPPLPQVHKAPALHRASDRYEVSTLVLSSFHS